ncbi:monocarboxylate permease [Aspergillus nomiae NRRL 13137]|uniref:Monocarboxylate permease n=1 Tax=Aspergillus nomiae NRRL (strain ATCC 15546 / NRRL 13137 / CBS 260.88 / M93) TaxID=1509407 RepID=A0A0L1JDQ9_ASPN3|nr:monocarboxylate permease [Aspergillus nomiae NRRL 13137]KNG89866.1 monocarboxylate permease [Aspergillus nomiae NRRL 13137]
MVAANREQDVPSIASTTINAISDDHSTPAVSVHLEKGLEMGSQPDQQNTTELVTSKPPRASPQPGEKREASGPPVTPAPGLPPDGGLQAWMTILGAFCGMFVSFGWTNCIGVFQAYYERHQLSHLSPSTIAWITSLETFVMFFAGPLFGTLFDNYGPRWILLAGTFFHVFGLMMASISTEYYQFILSQGICSPLGASAVFNASINSASGWFAKRRAFALGVAASGSSLGGVIFPIMVSKLIPQVDFGWAMRICAFLILFMLGITNLTLRSRLKPQNKAFDIMAFVRPLHDLKFVLTAAAAFCFFWGMFLPFTFVISSGERYGMSQNMSSYLLPILNAASIFGRTLPGYIADRIGRYNVMIIFSYFSAILVLALWLPSRGNTPIIIFSALYGFGSGAFVSLIPALIAQISDLHEVGARNGTCFSIISIAALTGSPIGGALVPDMLHGSYTRLQVFCGVVMMAGATLFVAARIVVGGMNLKKV